MWFAYPKVRGEDRDGFVEWARTEGAQIFKYNPEMMRVVQEHAS